MSQRVPATNFSESWVQVDRTEDPSFYLRVLDATRADLLQRARTSPEEFFASLRLEPGQRVLDAGCGTGDFLRLLAPLVDPGAAVGIDLSETMTEAARERTGREELNVSFRTADVQDLPFDDSSFDRVIATQLLLHVPDPWLAVGEFHRVLTPDGVLSIGEFDWESVLLECTDRRLGRRFSQLVCDGMRNGTIVRELPWRLRKIGFDDIRLSPEVHVSQDIDAFHTWLIEPSVSRLVTSGALSPDEGEFFLNDLRQRAETGTYFLSRTFYTVTATRS
jgi:ubiquinone/menaquinone biosynthesis C-methylase UbiE